MQDICLIRKQIKLSTSTFPSISFPLNFKLNIPKLFHHQGHDSFEKWEHMLKRIEQYKKGKYVCPIEGKSKCTHILANDTKEKVEIRCGWVYIIDFFSFNLHWLTKIKNFLWKWLRMLFSFSLHTITYVKTNPLLCMFYVLRLKGGENIFKKFCAKYANIRIRNLTK